MPQTLPHVSSNLNGAVAGGSPVPATLPQAANHGGELGPKALDHVETALTYLVDKGEKPAVYVTPIGEGEPRRDAEYAPYRVQISDARPLAKNLSLDREGFSLLRHDTDVVNFYDEDEVKSVYYPEMERLVKDATGASKVLVFDHTIRVDGGNKQDANGEELVTRTPVRNVHNDYTDRSGPQRVRDLLDAEEAAERLGKRFAVVNVWRPIVGPVEASPLAIADARSVAPDDFIETDLVYEDRVGEIHNVAHSPKHRWYYFPKMAREETMLIKCFDSATDGRARFTAHTAFDDPTTPADAAPRESIEIRTLVFF